MPQDPQFLILDLLVNRYGFSPEAARTYLDGLKSTKPALNPELLIAQEKQRLGAVNRYNMSLQDGKSPYELGPGAMYLKQVGPSPKLEMGPVTVSPIEALTMQDVRVEKNPRLEMGDVKVEDVKDKKERKETPRERAYREKDQFGAAVNSNDRIISGGVAGSGKNY